MKKTLLLTVSALLFSYCLTAQTDTTINGVTYSLFAPGLWVSFTCGDDDVTFDYNGQEVTYGTVESSGRCWLDRNLGADPLPFDPDNATGNTDERLYGDLFQWGRADEGHQLRGNTDHHNGQATTPVPNTGGDWDGKFIKGSDWLETQNDDLWQGGENDNNPCPPGWRVPTEAEWEAERDSWDTNNAAGAFASPLKLPLAGRRGSSNGSLLNVGTFGRYWSSTVSGTSSRSLGFGSSNASMNTNSRAHGRSVRCLKD